MKKSIAGIFILFVFAGEVYSQTGWVWQNPIPQGNTLNDNFFINENTGYIVGNKGVVLRTANSGNNWTTEYLSTSQNLNAVKFYGGNTGYIVGDSSKIYKTINGGYNWIKIIYSGNYQFNDIEFVNSNFGIIVASNMILISSNSGQNWENNLTLSGSYYLRKISFLDSNNIFIVGQKYVGGLPGYYKSVLLTSTNAGTNWTETNLLTSLLYSIVKLSNDNIICVGSQSIFKSTDRGMSWTNRISSIFATLTDVAFFDMYNGVAVGTDGNCRILKTMNGGDTWYDASSCDFEPNTVCTNSANSGFMAGKNGAIFKTTNTGSSWNFLPTVLQVYGGFFRIKLINENTGFIVGVGYDAPSFYGGSVLRTTNGGINWTSYYPCGNVTDVFFTSDNNGFITGRNGIIMKTTNCGSNWDCNFISSTQLNSIWFSDSLNGTIVGEAGKIYKTNNAGMSWYNQYSNPDIQLMGVHFINSNTGTAVGRGQGGPVLHTTDGGANWSLRTFFSYFSNLYDVFFIDNNTGFIIGEYSTVYKTTNAGINWASSTLAYPNELSKIKFIDNSTGFISGASGVFLKSTNTGSSWFSINTGTDQNINDFSFINNNTGIIVGSNLIILKTSTGGIVNVRLISSEVPYDYHLFQNYPNPFNPVTKIKFSIPYSSKVTLKVFDMLGKEVETLAENIFEAGVYESVWDGSDHQSGIYFLSLSTNNFYESRKMVLIK